MKVEIQSQNGSKIVNLNRRKAIHELCLNCSSWSPHEITKCEFKDCALYPYRLGTEKQNPKKRHKAIRDYCLWCSGGQALEIIKCVIKKCPLFAYRKYNVDKSVDIHSCTEKEHIDVHAEQKKFSAGG